MRVQRQWTPRIIASAIALFLGVLGSSSCAKYGSPERPAEYRDLEPEYVIEAENHTWAEDSETREKREKR